MSSHVGEKEKGRSWQAAYNQGRIFISVDSWGAANLTFMYVWTDKSLDGACVHCARAQTPYYKNKYHYLNDIITQSIIFY